LVQVAPDFLLKVINFTTRHYCRNFNS
jgi:hypothetical protein